MINALYQMAQLIESEGSSGKSIIDKLINPVNAKYVIVIDLNDIGSSIEYCGIDLIEYDSKDAQKYLYRRGSSSGSNITPSSMLTEVEKTYNRKVLAWFKNISNYKKFLNKDEIDFLNRIKAVLTDSKNQIISDITNKINDSSDSYLITLRFNKNDQKLYIGDIDCFKKLLIEITKKSYYEKYGTSSIGTGTCYVCGEEKEVFGFFTSIFPFYTLKQKGFAMNLDQSNAWKQYPICFDCAISLENAKQFLDKYFNFKFYGIKYYLLPHFMIYPNFEILDKIKEQEKSIKTKDAEIITNDENEIFDIISEQEDILSFNFLFYLQEQSAMRVLLYVEDVLPSRIKKIMETKKTVDNIDLYNQLNLKFNFEIPKSILMWNNDSYKSFLALVDAILKQRPVDEEFLLKNTIEYIRNIYVEKGMNEIKNKKDVIKTMMLFEFLYNYYDNHNNNGGIKIAEDIDKTDRVEIAKQIFQEHSDFFNTPIRRSAFLIGVFVGLLLDIQLQQSQATPFESKLHNLKLDLDKLKRIYVDAFQKLSAYNKAHYYKDLESLISEELLNVTEDWYNPDEISYCFVIGLNQSSKFKSKKEES